MSPATAFHLLDRYLPDYHTVERHAIAINAPPADVWPAVRYLDVGDVATIRALFALRSLPGLFARKTQARRAPGLNIDALLDNGFVMLGLSAPHELLLGLAGRFWLPTGDIVRLTPQAFTQFAEPGYARTVWHFGLEPTPTGTLLTTETRVQCVDDQARRSFRRYWALIGPFSGLIRVALLRHIRRQVHQRRR